MDPSDYLGLVHGVARRIHETLPRHVELDELVSLGTLGLFDALAKYEPEKGVFATYAYWRIRGAILDGLRAVPLPPPPEMGACRPAPVPSDVNLRRLDVLKGLRSQLNDRQLLLILLRYFLDMRLKEAGEVMGLSEMHANSVHLRAMAKLRK